MTKEIKPKIMIQKCMVCDYQAEWEVRNQEDEDTIRATVLLCGHQGLFTLEEQESGR